MTTISGLQFLDRGYENLIGKLCELGVEAERVHVEEVQPTYMALRKPDREVLQPLVLR